MHIIVMYRLLRFFSFLNIKFYAILEYAEHPRNIQKLSKKYSRAQNLAIENYQSAASVYSNCLAMVLALLLPKVFTR